MTPTHSSTPLVIYLLQALIFSFTFILSPLAIADWKFHNFTPVVTSSTKDAHLNRAEMSIKFKESALTFSIEKNAQNGEIKWLGMFTSPQAMKSLNSIETTNINPFDSSQAIILKITDPRSGMMGDGRMVTAFGINHADLKALSQTEGKLLVVNYDSHENADAVHFNLSNYAQALKQFEEHIKRAGMQHMLTQQ